MTASSPGRLLICRSIAIHLLALPPLHSGRVRKGETWILMVHGTDPLGKFSFFLKRTADVMAPLLSVLFRRLVRLGSFPAC